MRKQLRLGDVYRLIATELPTVIKYVDNYTACKNGSTIVLQVMFYGGYCYNWVAIDEQDLHGAIKMVNKILKEIRREQKSV